MRQRCCISHWLKWKALRQFFYTCDNFVMFSGVLQVQFPAPISEVLIVQAGQCGVIQLGEDPLGVNTSDGGVGVRAAEVSSQPLRPPADLRAQTSDTVTPGRADCLVLKTEYS